MNREDSRLGTPRKRLLIVASGAANVINLPDYLVALRTLEHLDVQVLMTRAAARLIPPDTVRLFCDSVWCSGTHDFAPGHVKLASWADRVAVIPATAHILGLVANGIAQGLAGAALLAHRQPLIFFPSMNSQLWAAPSVRRNIATLRSDGHSVTEPPMATSWIVATRNVEKTPGMPGPAETVNIIRELFEKAAEAGSE